MTHLAASSRATSTSPPSGGRAASLCGSTHPTGSQSASTRSVSQAGATSTRLYGEPNKGSTEIDPARDELELALTERALERDLPVLGICRGSQVLNVLFGGSLEQHREGHSAKYPPAGLTVADDPAGPVSVRHGVSPLAGSLLARACGEGPLEVNSSHHQVVTAARLGASLRATAWVDDLVEALESPRHRWVVGVQWHPERTAQVSPRATRIFEALVQVAEGVAA